MKKSFILYLFAGIISFGITSCAKKQKIVFVPESVQKIVFVPESVRVDQTFTFSPYYDNKGGRFKKEVDALWSTCLEIGLTKQNFKTKVESGEYKILSTTPKAMEMVMYKGTFKEFETLEIYTDTIMDLDGKCYGTEYIVEH